MAKYVTEETTAALNYLWQKYLLGRGKDLWTNDWVKCPNCGMGLSPENRREATLLQVPETDGWARKVVCPGCRCLCEIAYWSATLVDEVINTGK